MRRLSSFAFAVAGCASAPHPAVVAPSFDGGASWDLLARALPGTWQRMPAPGATRPPFVVTYRLVANGSALVEDWGAGGAHETETVFYRDHARLLETHFCAQGNQPRLAAVAGAADAVHFRFVDVTNREPDQAMLVDRALRVTGDALEITETYQAPAGGADDVTTYRFYRTGSRSAARIETPIERTSDQRSSGS